MAGSKCLKKQGIEDTGYSHPLLFVVTGSLDIHRCLPSALDIFGWERPKLPRRVQSPGCPQSRARGGQLTQDTGPHGPSLGPAALLL